MHFSIKKIYHFVNNSLNLANKSKATLITKSILEKVMTLEKLQKLEGKAIKFLSDLCTNLEQSLLLLKEMIERDHWFLAFYGSKVAMR